MRAYMSGLVPRGRCAVTDASFLKVCGQTPGSVVMPCRKMYLSSSCSKSAEVKRGPCSKSTTLKPPWDSSRAMTPPAAPEPTTTKSTVSLGLNLCAISSLLVGIGHEAGVLGVVVAERRREDMPVLEAHQLPTGPLIVPAIFRRAEHAQQREHALGFKERCVIHGLEEGDLLIRSGR